MQTWKYFFPDSDFDYKDYATHVLFVGNMPHTWREEDVITWINENSPARIDGKPDNFTVRCAAGGPGYNAYNRVYKKFAFVEFDLVEDAYIFLRECNGKQFNDSGRAVVAHPAVATGPPGRWLTKNWTTIPPWDTRSILHDEQGPDNPNPRHHPNFGPSR